MDRIEFSSGLTTAQVQAHRGASAVAPENTLAAFRAAYGQRARWVEFDVSLLGDGTPVVMHDATVDRCSDAKGYLTDMKVGDLAGIDAGSWFDPFYRNERIPTLQQALDCFAAFGLNGNLEIKRHKHQDSVEELTSAIHDVLKVRDPAISMGISSFDVPSLKAMRALDPEIELALLCDTLPENWRDILSDISSTVVHLNYKALTFDLLEDAVRDGYVIRAWTCNEPAVLTQYWGAGLAAVITDEPRYFLSR